MDTSDDALQRIAEIAACNSPILPIIAADRSPASGMRVHNT
jgi:hypothetical protein